MRDFVVVGLSHRTAPVEVRERLAVSPEDMQQELRELSAASGFEEALLISTCNRVELYATSANPVQATQNARETLSSRLEGVAEEQRAGPLDERMRLFFSDVDLSRRLAPTLAWRGLLLALGAAALTFLALLAWLRPCLAAALVLVSS